MKKYIGIFILLFLVTPFNSLASDFRYEKDYWVKGMGQRFPEGFCNKSKIFMACFDVTYEECSAEILESYNLCASKLDSEIPAIIDSRDLSEKLGNKLGSCTGSTYNTKMVPKFKKSSECERIMNEIKSSMK